MGRTRRASTVLVLGLVLVVVAPLAGTGTAAAQEEFQGILAGRYAFTVRIRAYTTDDELEELLQLLKEQGERALQDRLTVLDLASFQYTDPPSTNIGFVQEIPTDEGGRIIRLIASPFIAGGAGGAGVGSIDSARSIVGTGPPPRSFRSDEIFSIIDLRVNDQGIGTGEYFPAAKISVDGESDLNIDYGETYQRITNVKIR